MDAKRVRAIIQFEAAPDADAPKVWSLWVIRRMHPLQATKTLLRFFVVSGDGAGTLARMFFERTYV